MKYTPNRSGHIADAVVFVCIASAVVMFLANRIQASSGALLQLLSVVFLTAGLYVLIRYKLMGFQYIIRVRNAEENGYSAITDYDFVVERVQGSRISAECRLSLGDLIEVSALPVKGGRGREAIKKYGKSLRMYYYTVNMMPPEPYLLAFRDHSGASEDTVIGILFEPDKKMAEYLKNAVTQVDSMNHRTEEQ